MNEKWKDWKLLFIAVKYYSAIAGFSICKSREYIRCNRFGEISKRKNLSDDFQKPCEFNSGQLKAGCTFSITLFSTQREKSMPKNVTNKSKPKYRMNFNDNVIVMIKKACCIHAGLCHLSTQQQIVTHSRSGLHVKNMNEMTFFTLCNVMKHNNGVLNCDTIKSIVSPIWPTNKNMSKNEREKRVKKGGRK